MTAAIKSASRTLSALQWTVDASLRAELPRDSEMTDEP